MWVFLNDAFVSIVEPNEVRASGKQSDVLLVRARLKREVVAARMQVQNRVDSQTAAQLQQRLHLDGLRQSDDNPGAVASRIAMRTLFGAANPYGWPVGGTVDTVSALTLDDVRQEYRRLFDPATAVILVAGDLTVEEAKATFGKALGDWQGGAVADTPPSDLAAAPGKQLRVVVVDRPGTPTPMDDGFDYAAEFESLDDPNARATSGEDRHHSDTRSAPFSQQPILISFRLRRPLTSVRSSAES